MESEKEGTQVFHPSSIPVDRAAKQRENRTQSCRFCFYALIVILALFGGAVILAIGYFGRIAFNTFFFPTKQYALPSKHSQRFNASQVHPLIDASSTFDIRATVWQDVTDLLARGGELPQSGASPYQLVEYPVALRSGQSSLNFTRTEAIIFSGIVTRGATLQSKIHETVQLRVPVAPLYTSNIGRSSLRATFSIALPENQAKPLGSFRNASYIFSSKMPILPRRADFADRNPDYDLDTALAEAGTSTSLLELVPSPWFRLDSLGEAANRTINNRTVVSPFFSGHARNLRFLESTLADFNKTADPQLPEFRDGEGRILLPHIKTRSRIGMARSTDVFENATYQEQHRIGRIVKDSTCSNFIYNFCDRSYQYHSFETMLTFAPLPTAAEESPEDLHHYYAPVLTQVTAPGSPFYQRRIPPKMPTPNELDAVAVLRSNASAGCEIPAARLDASRRFFEFDWELYFSAHTLQRAVAAEWEMDLFTRPPPAPLGPNAEGEKELIANSVASLGEKMAFHSEYEL